MPYQSRAQQRFMYANKPKGVDLGEWAQHTDFRKLPERKSEDEKHDKKRKRRKEAEMSCSKCKKTPCVCAKMAAVADAVFDGAEEFWATRHKLAFMVPEHALTAADIAGLGILAEPTVHKMITGNEPSDREKAITELGGLGTLAATQVPKLTGHVAPPHMPSAAPHMPAPMAAPKMATFGCKPNAAPMPVAASMANQHPTGGMHQMQRTPPTLMKDAGAHDEFWATELLTLSGRA